MHTFLALMLRRLPSRFLEALNTVSLDVLDQRGLVSWGPWGRGAVWRHFLISHAPRPPQPTAVAAEAPTARQKPRRFPWLLVLLLLELAFLWGKHEGRGRFDAKPSPSTTTPTRPRKLDPSSHAPLNFDSFPQPTSQPSPPPLTHPTSQQHQGDRHTR